MDLDPKYDDYDYPTTSPETQSGHPGHTTKEQDAQVHQLRGMLEQAGYSDRLDTLTLLRFLRARKFNVQMSYDMYVFGILGRGLWVTFTDEILGSLRTRNGERSLVPMSWCIPLSTRRNQRSSSITLNTTTRLTR